MIPSVRGARRGVEREDFGKQVSGMRRKAGQRGGRTERTDRKFASVCGFAARRLMVGARLEVAQLKRDYLRWNGMGTELERERRQGGGKRHESVRWEGLEGMSLGRSQCHERSVEQGVSVMVRV